VSDVVLYDFWRSSAAYRVRIALNLKGLAYRPVAVDLPTGVQRSPENVARNPQGLVPTLEIDGLVLTQSLAICDYLDAKVDANPFVPKDAAARAKVLAMALVIAADIHPINNLRVLKYLETPLGHDQATRDAWYRHWIEAGFAALEAMVPDSAFLSGDAPGLADICLVPQMFNARRFEVDLAPYPKLVAMDENLRALDAFARAAPDAVRPA
jgi:maleylacetoacetate isomerase